MIDYYIESCADSLTCPDGYALDPDGKHCVESCASGKRAFDKAAGEYVCVTECPGYAPKFDGEETCLPCLEAEPSKPFWDGDKCVEKCEHIVITLEEHGNTYEMCTAEDECPGYWYANEDENICVAASVCKMLYSGYAYEATKECSTQEPELEGNFDPNEMKKNIYKCGPNAYFDPNTEKARCVTADQCSETPGVVAFADGQFGKRCVTMDECWALGKYVDATGLKCLSECPAGYVPGKNGEEKQMCVCENGLFYKLNGDSCVSRDSCIQTGYAYELDGDFLRCVSGEICTDEDNYLVETTRQCVSVCPEELPVYGEDDKVCRTCADAMG